MVATRRPIAATVRPLPRAIVARSAHRARHTAAPSGNAVWQHASALRLATRSAHAFWSHCPVRIDHPFVRRLAIDGLGPRAGTSPFRGGDSIEVLT
jgi:hypothetical protein